MTPALLLAQLAMIDIALAGDNAVVVGLAVARLPPAARRRAIAIGLGGAALLRLALSLVAVRLLEVLGLTLAGGLLLLWVAWKMFRELREAPETDAAPAATSLRAAIWRIFLADLSMSLDNVLAIAGVARGHPWVLVAGLGLSVLLAGVAASLLARLLARFQWIGWAGLAMVVYVALRMIAEGAGQLAPLLPS